MQQLLRLIARRANQWRCGALVPERLAPTAKRVQRWVHAADPGRVASTETEVLLVPLEHRVGISTPVRLVVGSAKVLSMSAEVMVVLHPVTHTSVLR